jgi:hypothetical protein
MEGLPGLFARTNKGKIFRYANVENEVYKIILIKADYGYRWEKYWLSKDENFVLSGEEIIDVIKEDDYVNGYLITRVSTDPFNGKKILSTNETTEFGGFGDRALIQFHNEDIETIVTKEDMERITYKENSRLWLQENIK